MNVTRVGSGWRSEANVRPAASLRVEQSIRKYLGEVQQVLDRVPVDDVSRVIDALIHAYLQDAQIFIMGNGGSAATAKSGKPFASPPST